MRAIKTFLWIQLVLGLLGGFLALAAIHSGEMSKAWVYGLRVEHDKMKQAAEYHAPLAIRDQSFDQILSDFEESGQNLATVAFYWLLTCGALVLFAIVMLGLVGRLTPPNQSPEPTRLGALGSPTSRGLASVAVLAWLSFGR
jgi:hypothetical protein